MPREGFSGQSASNFSREKRPEPVPSEPHCLVANVDPAFKKQIFNVAQRQRKSGHTS